MTKILKSQNDSSTVREESTCTVTPTLDMSRHNFCKKSKKNME